MLTEKLIPLVLTTASRAAFAKGQRLRPSAIGEVDCHIKAIQTEPAGQIDGRLDGTRCAGRHVGAVEADETGTRPIHVLARRAGFEQAPGAGLERARVRLVGDMRASAIDRLQLFSGAVDEGGEGRICHHALA